jgi:ABC-type uncharacterized transport system permease subunit
MSSPILLHVVNALLYAGLAVLIARDLPTSAPPPAAGRAATLRWSRYAVLIPILMHDWLLFRATWADGTLHMGVGIALSSIAWLTVLIYWVGSFFYRLDGLQVLVLPVAAVGALVPAVLPAARPLANADMAFFRLHLAISMLSYSLFTIASLHVLLMALVEKRLHGGTVPQLLRSLPPLLTMEQLLFRIIGTGFVLLTLTLATGMIFSEELFGRPLQFTHKVLFGVLSWLIFGALLLGRRLRGWRGRVAMRWTLAGFLALMLAYVGSRFVLEIILRR